MRGKEQRVIPLLFCNHMTYHAESLKVATAVKIYKRWNSACLTVIGLGPRSDSLISDVLHQYLPQIGVS